MPPTHVVRQPQPSEHIVQLFDSSKSLAETVADFLWMGLDRGNNLLLVVTPQHRHLLTKRLEALGLNVHEAIAANRMIVLDASDTLDKFMRQDSPSPVAFEEVIGTTVRRLCDRGRVWIYGEMVDVLAAKGNYKGAHALEELWNILGERECFTLLCGYASGHFGDARNLGALAQICRAHAHVLRKSDDLLAEYLLEQPEIKAVGKTGTAATFSSQS